MKKVVLFFIVSVSVLITYGQNGDTLFFNNLTLPNTPAISLLDQNPSIVETPQTGKALGISILNAIQANKGIPQNYAVECTPYWYFKSPNMTAFKYARIDSFENQKIFFDPSRISVSLATLTTTDTLNDFINGNISLGLRFNIITIKRKSDVQTFIKSSRELHNFYIELNKNFDTYIEKYYRGILFSNKPLYDSLLIAYYNNYPKTTGLKDSLNHIMNRKPIFTMDGAAAYNFFFENNNFKECHFGRLGAWITFRFSTPLSKGFENSNYFNFYGIGRYIMDGTTQQNGHYVNVHAFDVGGKAEIEVQKFAIGFEYVYRIQKNEESFRACGNIKYKLSDQLVLNCAFGRNFGTYNNVIAIMGINWGFNTGLENMSINK